MACGGSYAVFYPAKAFLEKEAKALTVGLYNSGEFINNPPVALGENAVVVVASHKGNTPETIEAAEIARQHGAPGHWFNLGDGFTVGGALRLCGNVHVWRR